MPPNVLHPPVLVLISLGARPLPLVPEAKFVLVAAAGVAASFAVGAAATRPSGHRTGRASPSGITGPRSSIS